MAERELLNALDDCMDRLAAGQSVEDCLRSHAGHAAALRPMLEAGLLARRARVSSFEVAQAQDRVRFRLAQHRRHKRSSTGWLRVAASLLIIFLSVFAGLSLTAESSLPGDSLYNLKRFTESARLLIGGDNPDLRQQFAARRRAEVVSLLALGRTADVDFEGELQAKQDSTWKVADLTVVITAGTRGVETVEIGDQVHVYGSTTHGELIASDVVLVQRGTPPIAPTATATPTSTLTETVTASPTLGPTATATATATPTSTPTTRRRIPTSAPQVTPTVSSGSSGSSGDDGSHHSGDGSSGSSGSSGTSVGSGSSGSDGGK